MRIAKLKKQAFGVSSEKIEREIEQLELTLEDLFVAAAESDASAHDESDDIDDATSAEPEAKPLRRPRVSGTTPPERRGIDPGETCPDCGGELRVVGEDSANSST